MKFGTLIEHNMKIIFSWKIIYTAVAKPVQDHFTKNQIWAYPWSNKLKCCKFIFIVYPSTGHLLLIYVKLFLKSKKEIWN